MVENLLQNINKLELFLKKKKKSTLELKPKLDSNKVKEIPTEIKKVSCEGKENISSKLKSKSKNSKKDISKEKTKSKEKKVKKIEKRVLPVDKTGIPSGIIYF